MKKLLLSISAFGLMGYATSLYAMYESDCLEMLCDWGCKETPQVDGKLEGRCCPEPTRTSCIAEQKEEFGCVTVKKIECPLDKFCASDGTCKPCSTADGRAKRFNKNSTHCECPAGLARRCNSKSTNANCKDGGNWVCTNGCFDHTDCPADQQCSCVGNTCPAKGGTCGPCPEGTHRAETSATVCMACTGCQTWDIETQTCQSQCLEGQFCGQKAGGTAPNCAGDICMQLPPKSALVEKRGTLNDRKYYIPPAEDKYKMTHASASRFCEYYGMHLGTVDEVCMKDYAYDTGYDCPNFVSTRSFSWLGQTFDLSWWHVDGMGSFWLANLGSGDTALRVTYSCGNNHSSHVCNRFYPLCTEN